MIALLSHCCRNDQSKPATIGVLAYDVLQLLTGVILFAGN